MTDIGGLPNRALCLGALTTTITSLSPLCQAWLTMPISSASEPKISGIIAESDKYGTKWQIKINLHGEHLWFPLELYTNTGAHLDMMIHLFLDILRVVAARLRNTGSVGVFDILVSAPALSIYSDSRLVSDIEEKWNR